MERKNYLPLRSNKLYNYQMVKKVARESTVTTVVEVADSTLDEVEKLVEPIGKEIEETVAPIRKSVLKRFPILVLLIVTFGFTATITGVEQVLLQHDILQSHPWVIFFLGIGTLVLTGTLYKKLG